MTVTVKNADRLAAALKSAGPDAVQVAGKALKEVAYEVFALSQFFVPVDTGALRASGQVHDPKIMGSRISVEITYGGPAVDYAALVHELPPSVVRHVEPTRWKYLEFPMEMMKNDLDRMLAQRMEDMLNDRFGSIV